MTMATLDLSPSRIEKPKVVSQTLHLGRVPAASGEFGLGVNLLGVNRLCRKPAEGSVPDLRKTRPTIIVASGHRERDSGQTFPAPEDDLSGRDDARHAAQHPIDSVRW